MKNLIKLTLKGFILLLLVNFMGSCNSTESEGQISEATLQAPEQEAPAEEQTEQLEENEVQPTVVGQTLRMIGDKINLRSEPSIKGDILTQLRINEVFEIKGRTANTETLQTQTDYWYQIEKNGETGWIFGALTTKTLNEKENVDPRFTKLTIQGDKVNVRTKPSVKGDVIMQLNSGQTFDFKKRSDTYETIGYDTDYWYQIEFDGKRGWIFGSLTSRALVSEGCAH